ncbi:MAG: energy-coupled thiamine transporter ThiT [Candidatus Izemoplasmatales bacterium]
MKKKQEVQVLIEVAIFVAIAIVLDILFGMFSTLPYGGSISVAMLPIFIVAARRGLKYGLIAGLLFGIIPGFLFKVYFLNFGQYFLDYILAFTVLGVGALIPKAKEKTSRFVWLIIVGSVLRLIAASLAGVAYWAAYIPEEMVWFDGLFGTALSTSLGQDALIFVGSFVYNSLYLIPSAILCIIIGIILHKRKIIEYNLH